MTRLMSYCAMPMVAATRAVAQPTIATTVSACGSRANSGKVRAIR